MTTHRHWTSLPDDIPGIKKPAAAKPQALTVENLILDALRRFENEQIAQNAVVSKLQETVAAQDRHIASLMRQVHRLENPQVAKQAELSVYDKFLSDHKREQAAKQFSHKPLLNCQGLYIPQDGAMGIGLTDKINEAWGAAQGVISGQGAHLCKP